MSTDNGPQEHTAVDLSVDDEDEDLHEDAEVLEIAQAVPMATTASNATEVDATTPTLVNGESLGDGPADQTGQVADKVVDEIADPAGDGSGDAKTEPKASTESTQPTIEDRDTQGSPPALPPRVRKAPPPPLPPRRRTPFFWLIGGRSAQPSSPSALRGSPSGAGGYHRRGGRSASSGSDYDLLLHRLDVNSEGLNQRDASEKDASLSGIRQLQQSFDVVRHATRRVSMGAETDIDWEFWSDVVVDYANVARTRSVELSQAIARGFPGELRGLLWQLIASSKSATLEEVYQSILSETSPHEKAIKRDLSRTSFVKNASMESLFKIIKAYSLFDPEVGYTQGMAFITVPILMNMSEPEAFCLLAHLMKDYQFRELFLPEMPGLHLRLYQFERIVEDTLPGVHAHLARQGVRSSMYASQWFLTMFAYKFPLQIVVRIFDIVIAEGYEAVLKFGVALMRRNAETIMSLDFDELLTFLKERIFDYYSADAGAYSEEPRYRANDLVLDAFEVKLLPLTLRKYEDEYAEIHRLERERVEEVESLRNDKGQLQRQVRQLESSLAQINQEHVSLANQMIHYKVEADRLKDENDSLTADLTEAREKLAAHEGGETSDLAQQNAELLETKKRLESQLENLERELLETKQNNQEVCISLAVGISTTTIISKLTTARRRKQSIENEMGSFEKEL